MDKDGGKEAWDNLYSASVRNTDDAQQKDLDVISSFKISDAKDMPDFTILQKCDKDRKANNKDIGGDGIVTYHE